MSGQVGDLTAYVQDLVEQVPVGRQGVSDGQHDMVEKNVVAVQDEGRNALHRHAQVSHSIKRNLQDVIQ